MHVSESDLHFGFCKISTAEAPLNRALFSHSKAVIVLLWFPDFSVIRRQEGDYKWTTIIDRDHRKTDLYEEVLILQ